ncbi:unnamed protein product [Peronospora destructor]|uniref:Uncharacterized protein n=1 Tax=Peronospora destructor TaxID=86335 RepID=A0AAV0UPZ1_9STRA|nr:unnamed protein product [Peronospora destructor]
MASPPDSDYSRPQTWRNMPQQQERSRAYSSTGHQQTYKMESMPRAGHSSSNVSARSFDSTAQLMTYSDPVMATNASVAATAVAQGATYTKERATSVSSATSSATRSSVDTAVETMWEARRTREKAEEEADQKLLDAVCKASLAEYNERKRALKDYESEILHRSQEHQMSTIALQQAKSCAEQRKLAAMQTVIDCKTRAHQMGEKAREATLLYEQKSKERLAKQAEFEALKLRDVQEAELLVVQKRKEEAICKRAKAEQKAREAHEKAEAMRRQAFQAASKVRANSRRQIETQLGEEEAHRRREMQRKLDEIEKNKEIAHQRKEAATKKAEIARRRAEELRLKAEQARAGIKSFTAAATTSSAS